MAKEIELKFLCNDLVDSTFLKGGQPVIFQGYLHVDKTQQIRVRVIGADQAFICIKHMIGDGVERNEFEYEIPYEDGLELLHKCVYKFKKRRYTDTTAEGYHIDVDLYEDGLMTAEVELPTRDTTFTKPKYFGEDITGVHKYCNYAYAGIPEYLYQ